MLSLQPGQRDILRVEGVAVPGLAEPEDALLPPGAVQLAGQVVPWVIRPATKYYIPRKNSKYFVQTDLTLALQLLEQYPHSPLT